MFIDYTLYLVTDRKIMSTSTLEEAVEQAIQGGCTMVQLREKELSSFEFYQSALKIKKITDQYKIPLIINDRIDVALAVCASGVHIGQSDLPADVVRHVIGKDMILGVSVSSVGEAKRAEKDGADYLGVGAMFSTSTKSDATLVPMDELKKIRQTVFIPIVAIGGIGKNNVALFQTAGINGVAVVSAIIAEADIKAAAAEMKSVFCNGKE